MRNENTVSKTGFIVEHLFWALLGWIWYKCILFRCLGHYSLKRSGVSLIGMIAVCCTVGIMSDMKKRRNGFSVFQNVVFAYGLYTVMAYLPVRAISVRLPLYISLLLAAAYTAVILFLNVCGAKRSKKVLKKCLVKAFCGVRRILAVGLGFVIILIGAGGIFGFVLIRPSTIPTRASAADPQTICGNIETLAMFQQKVWKTLSVEEKLDILQTEANIEGCFLGLPHELNVGAKNLEEGLEGYYYDPHHQIVVNLESLISSPPEKLCNTIAHEARHAAQHRMIDVYNEAAEDKKRLIMFQNAARYKKEFENYSDGFSNFREYYEQAVEKDARRYAEDTVKLYFEMLEKYLNGTGSLTSALPDRSKP